MGLHRMQPRKIPVSRRVEAILMRAAKQLLTGNGPRAMRASPYIQLYPGTGLENAISLNGLEDGVSLLHF